MDDKVQYWLDIARYDLSTAKVVLTGGKHLYVGFMCHQTIEKALKAYFTKAKNETPPYVHNLIRLSELTGLLELYGDQQRQTIISLNPMNIEARYPVQKQKIESQLTGEYCARLIEETEELLLWIENKLSE